jgi:hypothetical protein
MLLMLLDFYLTLLLLKFIFYSPARIDLENYKMNRHTMNK